MGKKLLDIVTQRLLTKHNNELEVEIRFPTLKIAPDLEDLRKALTPAAFDLVLEQSMKSTTWPSYARWNAVLLNLQIYYLHVFYIFLQNSVAANDIHLLPNNLPSVTTVVGPGPKRRNAKQAITELNMVLQTISTTVQGFPVPVLCGCINMLRSINNRWRANVPADLGDGNLLIICRQIVSLKIVLRWRDIGFPR